MPRSHHLRELTPAQAQQYMNALKGETKVASVVAGYMRRYATVDHTRRPSRSMTRRDRALVLTGENGVSALEAGHHRRQGA